jgi:hypothetical protein
MEIALDGIEYQRKRQEAGEESPSNNANTGRKSCLRRRVKQRRYSVSEESKGKGN